MLTRYQIEQQMCDAMQKRINELEKSLKRHRGWHMDKGDYKMKDFDCSNEPLPFQEKTLNGLIQKQKEVRENAGRKNDNQEDDTCIAGRGYDLES